jgi:hypothetical protein
LKCCTGSACTRTSRYAGFLQGCTQLKALSLYTNNIKGASALAQLTGLTQLELPSEQLFSAEEQSELGSALAALSNLQSLLISHAPPGPVTQALSQLTGLTELTLTRQDLVPNPGPLILPSCVRLSFCPQWNDIAIQHLRSTDAPQLRHLVVSLAVKPSDLDALALLCKGVLRACSSLAIHLDKAWSKEDTVALMAVLSQDWQPAAEALQLLRCSIIGLERSCTSDLVEQWGLRLRDAHLSRQCLELLPRGLSVLWLWWVRWLHKDKPIVCFALLHWQVRNTLRSCNHLPLVPTYLLYPPTSCTHLPLVPTYLL